MQHLHHEIDNPLFGTSMSWSIEHFQGSWAFLGGSLVNLPASTGDENLVPGWEDALGKEMASHSSIFAWAIPQTEELGGFSSRDHKRGGHD